MPCRISVVVQVERDGPWLADLVTSLDQQSLPCDQFEAVFAHTDDAALSRRLNLLAERRPYIRTSTHTAPADLLSEASGAWVVYLGPDAYDTSPRFFPEGLERTADLGDTERCDVVLSRTVGPDRALNATLLTDHVSDGAALGHAVGSGCLVTQRRETAVLATDGLTSARSVGVLGRYPALRTKATVEAGRPLRLTESTVGWQDGRLVVDVIGSVADAAAEAPVVFAAHHTASGLEFWFPAATSRVEGDAVTASVAVDVRTAAAGGPLAPGVWELSAALGDTSDGWTALEAVPLAPFPAGIVDGVFVVPRGNTEQVLSIDVGARRSSAVGRVAPEATTVTESHHGTLLTMRLDGAVHGDATIPGSVYLDTFPLPARIVCTGGQARVECWVSGLAGTAKVGTQFGGGSTPTPTGLSLVTSATGAMSVIATPAKADPSAASPAASRPRPTGVARVRRAVPGWLEPAATSVSRIPLARKVYRSLSVKPPERG